MPQATVNGPEVCQARCVHPETVADTRNALHDAETYHHLAVLFRALADPTRVKIVHALTRQELCSCDIAGVAGITPSGASQHLRVLRSLRLVKSRRAGKLVYYSIDDAHVTLLVQVSLAHLGHQAGPDDHPQQRERVGDARVSLAIAAEMGV